jgi:formate-dependent nitrite reductase cytochrome c552 subunit
VCCCRSKQHQQELEDVALDLRQELDDTKQQLAQAQQSAQAAAQRSAAAEAKVVAAGLGPLPKMGPTAEQLVINSTQRIK